MLSIRVSAPHRWSRAFVMASFSALLSACGDDPVRSEAAIRGPSSTVIVGQGFSTVAAITVTRAEPFAGNVTLAAEGVPEGLIVSFEPASLTSSVSLSEMHIIALSSLSPGSHNITVRGTATGGESRSTIVAVQVTRLALSIAAASNATVVQGATQTIPITVARQGGYTGIVGLSVFGLPDGMTATFSPAVLQPGQTTSTLTLSAPLGVETGIASLALRASAQGLDDNTAPVQLTIAPATTPAVALSVATSSLLQVNGGQTLEIPLTLKRFAGFNGAVSVDVPGLPPTVVAEVAPFAPGATSTTLRLHVSELETGGAGNITIRTNAAGIEQASTIVSLRRNAVSKIFLSFGPPVTLDTPVNPSIGITMTRGSSATVPITLTRVAVAQEVGIVVFEKPSGVLLDFPFTLAAGTAPQSLGLTINVTSNAVPGVYQMVVRGHDMAWARYSFAYLTLTIN